MKIRLKQKIKRLIAYEYWPFYLFYLPFLPIWLIYSLITFDFLYFLRVNPAIKFGGFLQYSKFEVIERIPKEYLAESFYFTSKPNDLNFYKNLLNFPLIYKPDIGERGKDVHLFKTEKEFKSFLPSLKDNFILQEYCDYSIELGVLYHRFPNGKSNITSIVKKEFLEVIGDGELTLGELTQQNIRAFKKLDYFKLKFNKSWNEVLNKGTRIVLEEIGNHCRGTKFLDACELINPQLIKVFDEIVKHIPDFYYGRFDLKVKSIDDLYEGKNIKIFELNGVNSEVAHIYDPKHSLLYAYKHVLRELHTVYLISKALKKKGISDKVSYLDFSKALIKQLIS